MFSLKKQSVRALGDYFTKQFMQSRDKYFKLKNVANFSEMKKHLRKFAEIEFGNEWRLMNEGE